jgi:ATP-dependent Lhr-like helicase
VRAIDTVAPSPMSHEILNSNPYTYLDDAPLEERRARAVSLRRTDPDLAGGLGALDPEAIAEVRAQSWPDVRDADELHDALLSLGLVPQSDVDAAGWEALAAELVRDGRATWGRGGAVHALVAAERVGLARAIEPGLRCEPPLAFSGPLDAVEREAALGTLAGGWLEVLGPVTAADLARRLGLSEVAIEVGLAARERVGMVLRGRFTPGVHEEEWCDRRLLARIHRLTLGRLRREIEPVSAADAMRFLFRWQHLHPGTQLHGRDGLLEVVGQLQGLELPARAWEASVFPARIAHYDPNDLDGLCLAGAVAWGRLRADAPGEEELAPRPLRAPGRAAPLAFVLRQDLPWLLGPGRHPALADVPDSAAVHAVLAHLERHGASFLADVVRGTGLLPAAVEEALWALVARGLVTGDGTAGLRALLRKDTRTRARRLKAVRGGKSLVPAGRWALLRTLADGGDPEPMRFARQLLRRYGLVLRELLARETGMPRWRVLLGALRALEARGEIRGGRFVAGLVGEQFALPEAVEALRAVRRRSEGPEVVTVAAADPLNLVGILVPGTRLAATAREVIAFRDGVPVETGELGAVLSRLQRAEVTGSSVS